MNVKEAPVVARIKAQVEKPKDAVDLTGYPHLVFAPQQWGEGVRVASNGIPVKDIAVAAKRIELATTIEAVAHGLDLTWDELFDALRYARDHGPL